MKNETDVLQLVQGSINDLHKIHDLYKENQQLKTINAQLVEALRASLVAFNSMPEAAVIAYNGRDDFDVVPLLRAALAAGERGDATLVSECDECGHPMRADDETHYPECERINVT